MAPAIIAGLFGAIIGSFLNVVVLRRGIRSLAGRSGCLSCRAAIRWFDNIPVVSYFLLRGRCRDCGSGISVQYPLVEASTALLFGLIAYATPSAPALTLGLSFGMIAILVAIATYDIQHTIIPDAWAYLFTAAALVYGAALWIPHYGTLAFVLAGPAAALPLFLLWLVSRGRWMGLGDAKLALGIGYLLGPVDGIFAVFFAFVIGAVIALGILLPLPHIARLLARAGIARKASATSFTMKSEVPFGPFLIASTLLVWFSHLYSAALVPWY